MSILRNIFFCYLLVGANSAEAVDNRYALLLGHQQGWQNEPHLRYVIKGDLEPMEKTLRKLGYKVSVLRNPTANKLRSVFQALRQKVRSSNVSTFLLYYSGHADKKHLHLGSHDPHPLSYKELISFLDKLPVQRRFAILDACFSGELVRLYGSIKRYQSFLKNGLKMKGLSGINPRDLRNFLPNQGHQTKGLQIIASSLHLSFESKLRKASVFTYFIHKGLKGEADLDGDGKISFAELYGYASRQVKKETGQHPQRLDFTVGGESYSIAPAYHSRLLLNASLTGQLHISVSNFSWHWNKQKNHTIRLAIIPGKGVVRLKKGSRCWSQQINIPKQKEVRLGKHWRSVKCLAKTTLRKGSIDIPPQIAHNADKTSWSVELSGGILTAQLPEFSMLQGGSATIRFHNVGFTFTGWGTNKIYTHSEQTTLQFEFIAELGYRNRWQWFDLFVGGYTGIAVMVQNIQLPRTGSLFRYGAKCALGVPILKFVYPENDQFAIVLELDAGFALGQFEPHLQNIFMGKTSLGIRYYL